MDITITLTETEYKALEFAANSPQDWAENALKERARVAKDAIIEKLVAHCNANSIALEIGEAAQVQQAYNLNILQTAAERNAIQEP